MHSWLIKATFHSADKRNVQNNDCLSAKHKCVNFGSGAVTKPNEFKKCLSHPFCFRVSFSSNAAQYGIVISQSSCNIWSFELWGVTTGHVLLQIELLEKSRRFLLTTSASHCHFNAPQASVLAQVMMRSVVSGSQQRRRENLRMRAAEVTTNVLIFKHSLTLIVRYFSSHQFTGVHWYSHHDISATVKLLRVLQEAEQRAMGRL